jgi:hypothetical protein
MLCRALDDKVGIRLARPASLGRTPA